ncbi:hypothetical protein [Pseudobutyrivibrio ruminis]|uniref:Uncharacterized protein n=1 Tax=Pseudobutyrivibrio ruminis TaxID=46206 RepID=A0A2G3DT72_9FIRM|nr:hypothetical protein [Pseudobutyrivibrio ruminis]PHU34229.1 hypothetical protein CSX01_11730 [Pseudobutyrivibrio ruminis]
MIIKKTETYYLELKEEDSKRDNHNILNSNDFEFKGIDLLRAIAYMGMSPGKIASFSRKKELEFKIAMVEHVLDINVVTVGSAKKKYIVLNEVNFSGFESAEKRAIDFWLGMFFATLLIQKQYKYNYAVHFSKYYQGGKSRHKFDFNKAITTIKEDSKSAPDLLGLNLPNDFGLFEAKGCIKYDDQTMEHAYDQVKRFATMDSVAFKHNNVLFSVLGDKDKIKIICKDPQGEEGADFDYINALFWQHKPLIELVEENRSIQKSHEYLSSEYIKFDDGNELVVSVDSKLFELYEKAFEYLGKDDASDRIKKDFKDIFKGENLITIK